MLTCAVASLSYSPLGDLVPLDDLESLAHATAWLAPLPPGDVAKLSAVRVSPGRGSNYGVSRRMSVSW
jgi:hypothetical protein